jgi:hypothetical protein
MKDEYLTMYQENALKLSINISLNQHGKKFTDDEMKDIKNALTNMSLALTGLQTDSEPNKFQQYERSVKAYQSVVQSIELGNQNSFSTGAMTVPALKLKQQQKNLNINDPVRDSTVHKVEFVK